MATKEGKKESRKERRRREREEQEASMAAALKSHNNNPSQSLPSNSKPKSKSRRTSPAPSSISFSGSNLDSVPNPMDQAEAGPSRTRNLAVAGGRDALHLPNGKHSGFDSQTDFIPLDSSDPERSPKAKVLTNGKDSSGKGKARQTTPPVREWDRGKPPSGIDDDAEGRRGKGRDRDRDRDRDMDRDRRGRKRPHDAISENDNARRDSRRKDKYSESLKAPWIEQMDWENCNNVAEMMHNEVEAFIKWASPTREEDEMRGLVVAQISKAVATAFPDAQVHPFGSFATKLYLPLGDIDLVILSHTLEHGYKDEVLRDLARVVKRAGITSNITIISRARVPIIKFTSNYGSFHVDISIGQTGGLKSVDIVNGFLRDMHGGKSSMALRALVLIAKAFLSQRSMNEVYTGGLGSYSIVCLAISFLQMHPKIRRGEIDPDRNLGVLVMEFFELYGLYFNYDEVGISVREGGMYYSKRQRGWLDYYARGLLSIEDPADPTNDISKGSFHFQKVRTTMAGAFGILSTKLYQRAALMRARRDGRAYNLRDEIPPEDLSILASVLRITQETINHRRLVEEQYHSQELQSILGIKPTPIEVLAVPRDTETSRQRVKEAQSVASAWEEAEDELVIKGASKPRMESDGEEEDGGRYNIGRQPPRKRQKTGRHGDKHTVFVVEDDSSLMEQELQYVSDESEVQEVNKSDKDRNRSYWLSKAMEAGLSDYSSS